jgi:hypothetical protein
MWGHDSRSWFPYHANDPGRLWFASNAAGQGNCETLNCVEKSGRCKFFRAYDSYCSSAWSFFRWLRRSAHQIECDFDSYHPLKIGTPIRGGHEDLAIERVTPTYPEQAQQNGIGGQVDAQVLVNRAGDVV